MMLDSPIFIILCLIYVGVWMSFHSMNYNHRKNFIN